MLRSILPQDIPIIDQWISQDPAHIAKGMTADFFLRPDTIAFAIDDKHGPIMYMRVDPLNADMVRVHMQFDETQRRRTVLALMRNFPQVRYLISESKAKYMVFDSVSESLIRFCQKRFGFIHLPDSNDYFLDISRQD